MPGPGGTGETRRPGEPLGERMARLETHQRLRDKHADERHGELLGAVQEAASAAREASAAATEVGRSVTALASTVTQMDGRLKTLEKERDTDRYAPVPVYREAPSQPISVSPLAGHPGGPPANDVAEDVRWLRNQRLKQGAQVGGVVALLTALIEIVRWLASSGAL